MQDEFFSSHSLLLQSLQQNIVYTGDGIAKICFNEIMGLLMNVTFSDKIEIFNYSHTIVFCTVTFTLLVNLLTNTVMYNKSINLYVQLEVCIFTKLLFLL